MARIRLPKADINDILLSISVTAIIVLWSLLVRNDQASAGGFLVAVWFPVSILTARLLLRRLPVLGGLRAHPAEKSLAWKRRITVGCLLVASFSILFLACLPPPAALGTIIALNLACLAALLDRAERWLPPALLSPMLLAGLLAGILRDAPSEAILGAVVAWGGMIPVLGLLRLLLGRSALSGGEALMAAACGAWVQYRGAVAFLLVSLLIHAVTCALAKRLRPTPFAYGYSGRAVQAPPPPVGPSLAFGLAITLLIGALAPQALRVFAP